MKTQKDKNYTRLNLNIPDDLKKRFVRVAKENDTDASKLVRGWIKEYLAKNSSSSSLFL